ncbi:MAG: protein YgfX [Gammaproteobacteria bacterium]
MSSTRSAPNLTINPRPDIWLAVWLGLVHSAAAASAWLLPVHVAIQLSWLTVCVAGAILGLRRHLLRRGRGAVTAAQWNRAGDWTVTDGTGSARAAELVSIVTLKWLILIEFRVVSGEVLRLALGPGSLHPGDFRRLAVRLRLQRFVA